jgi:glycosyltransferase involved in cell wall biosynthesis
MKLTKIFLWQSGEPLVIDKDNHVPMRATNLSNFLQKRNFDITLISSNFNHTSKKFREKKINKYKIIKIKKNLRIALIDSPGYRSNIGLSRLIDHIMLAKNLKYFLNHSSINPEVAFIGFPPIETTIYFARWLASKKIPFIVDIKDLWPEYFYERIDNKFLSNLIRLLFIFHNYFLIKYLKKSHSIVANNSFFLNFTLDKIKRKKNKTDVVFFLTKQVLKTNSKEYLKKIKFNKKKFNIYFCGRVDLNVFDFDTVFKALLSLDTKKLDYHFYIGGYGNEVKIKSLILKYSLNNSVTYLGYLDQKKHVTLLKNAKCFIAPYINKMNFSFNLSNKIIESIQYNLPIVTPLKEDVAKIIIKYGFGLIYKEGNYLDLAHKIFQLQKSLNKTRSFKKRLVSNSKIIFNHEKNYKKITEIIDYIT